MLLTIVSFVYISNQWIWHLPNNSTVLGMYCIFLLGALTWSPMIADSFSRTENLVGGSIVVVGWRGMYWTFGVGMSTFFQP